MAEHVFRNIETGGNGESNRHKESEKSLTWKERLKKRLARKHEATEANKPEAKVSFVEFFKNIFNDKSEQPKPDNKRSWIDRAFDEQEAKQAKTKEVEQEQKLEKLDENERTEFYMVVAERFKQAGSRFVEFIGKLGGHTDAERELNRDYTEADQQISESSAREEGAESDIESAPPFEFVQRAARNPSENIDRQHALETVDRSADPEQFSFAPDIVVPTGPDGDYSPREMPTIEPTIRHREGDVDTRIYSSSFRDALVGGLSGRYAASYWERRRVERKFERKLKKRDRKIAELKDQQKETEEELQKVEEQLENATTKMPTSTPSKLAERAKIFRLPLDQTYPATQVEQQQPEIKEVSFYDLPPKPKPKVTETAPKTHIAEAPSFEAEKVMPAPEVIRRAIQEANNDSTRAVEAEQSARPIEREPVPETSNDKQADKAIFDARERTRQAASSQAVSLNEILSERASASSPYVSAYSNSEPAKKVRERIAEQYNLDNPRAVNSWMITGVVLALVLISAIFAVSS